jgi:hypothetical protein
MPKLEPEVELILKQRKCGTCHFWGRSQRGVFKLVRNGKAPARRCGMDAKLVTTADDVCSEWQQT